MMAKQLRGWLKGRRLPLAIRSGSVYGAGSRLAAQPNFVCRRSLESAAQLRYNIL